MTKTRREIEPPKPMMTSAEREARKAFRQVDAEKAMTEHEIAQKAFSNNRERLKAERLAREARRRAEWRGNTLVLQARSRTARSASSLPTFRATVMRSSIARYIFRRNGPTIQIVWKPHMCLPVSALRPSQSLQRACSHAP